LTPRQAVKLRRMLMLVVDAGRGPSGDWIRSISGPSGRELVMAAADTAIDASVRAGFTAFERIMIEWREELIRWRCGLSAAERQRLGASPGWNCRNLHFYMTRLAFDDLPGERAAELNQVETTFRLPVEQVDKIIEAGRDVLRGNGAYRAFLDGL
jgi:NTE family protein